MVGNTSYEHQQHEIAAGTTRDASWLRDQGYGRCCAYCGDWIDPADKPLTDASGAPVHLDCAECMVEEALSPEARLIMRARAVAYNLDAAVQSHREAA